MWMVTGYTYNADHWCERCLRDAGVDPNSEEVGIMSLGTNKEVDSPAHCNVCDRLLDCSLTPDGVQYVIEALAEAIFDPTAYLPTVKYDETAYDGSSRVNGLLDDWHKLVEPYIQKDDTRSWLIWRHFANAEDVHRFDILP